jgi:branched-chain amino acid transport system substrate-binding protein
LGRRSIAALALAALVSGGIGCGASDGVAEDATVSVYVSAPLHGEEAARGSQMCAGAKRQLALRGGRAGDVRVRVVCLDDTGGSSEWRLAAVGANARRAVEDSSTVAYVGELEPEATRFSRPIVEAAGIAQVSEVSGSTAMGEILKAIDAAGDGDQLRQAVSESLASGPGA